VLRIKNVISDPVSEPDQTNSEFLIRIPIRIVIQIRIRIQIRILDRIRIKNVYFGSGLETAQKFFLFG
jgi:hypothetical protein